MCGVIIQQNVIVTNNQNKLSNLIYMHYNAKCPCASIIVKFYDQPSWPLCHVQSLEATSMSYGQLPQLHIEFDIVRFLHLESLFPNLLLDP